MSWNERIQMYLQQLAPVTMSKANLFKMTRLLDLTNLEENINPNELEHFFSKARSEIGDVACVCVRPNVVRKAVSEFASSPIKVATVANFPKGETALEAVLIEINQAIEDGAQELDVVFPYQRFLKGEERYAEEFVSTCKAACGPEIILKIILETGAFTALEAIASASNLVLKNGANFIKTSTGKVAIGATLAASACILLVIKEFLESQINPDKTRPVGIKISGGLSDAATAALYLELADRIMPAGWASPETFRFGSSRLLDDLLKLWGSKETKNASLKAME